MNEKWNIEFSFSHSASLAPIFQKGLGRIWTYSVRPDLINN